MKREDKLKLFKELGWRYDPSTGDIFSHTGKKPNQKGNGYIKCVVWYKNKSVTLQSHQLAWFLYYNEVALYVDHIDRNKRNNKIDNLRSVTSQENNFNRTCKGSFYNKLNKNWRAQISINNKTINIGTFKTEEEAIQSYLNAKKTYHKIGSGKNIKSLSNNLYIIND
jgi:hypothetical protein